MAKFNVLIIEDDPMMQSVLHQTLMSDGQIEILAETESLIYGYELIRQNSPHMVFIHLRDNPLKTLETVQRIGMYFRNTIVVVSGKDMSMELLIACMQAGAREFITRPLKPEDIQGVIQKHKHTMSASGTHDKTGRVITVFSNKGGLGKTTLAVNLAITLSKVVKKPVVLVDLNLQLGDITTFLNIEPKQTIVDIAKNIGQVDAIYLENSLAEFQTGDARVFVLADPLNMEEAEEVTADQINAVLTVLRNSFEYVIVDTTTSFDSKTLTALDLADDILLTSIVNLPCIRSSQRLLHLFERLGYDKDKIKLIVNRYVDTDEISAEDMQETLEHPVFWKVPNAYQVVMSSINQGVYIGDVANSNMLVGNFTELAHKLCGKIVRSDKPAAAPDGKPTDKSQKPSLLPDLNLFKKK